ncbi:MAG TPA: M20/M25/M40 family metallo-hydrolase, partial [Gemmatimonadaceae bacterium]|nr:M20/M25/M40 family metallo-hydrolase [Gemmatimonadaceae bacterium]
EAAEWARRELASYGLANAALEPWGARRGRGWVVDSYSVELTEPRYARIVASPRAWSPPTAGVVRGRPVVLELRDSADLDRHRGELRGAIVLAGPAAPRDTAHQRWRFQPPARRRTPAELDSMARLADPGAPRDYWEDAGGYTGRVRARLRFAARLREAGVAALLEPSRNEYGVQVSSYQAYDTDVSGAVPAFVVARPDYDRLVRLAERGGPMTVELSLRAHYLPASDSTGYNVVAELPGSDPALRDEVVMLGGHFDSWNPGTGATDNAAGVAAAMEAVRILAAVGARPRRTVRVALWDGEEHEDYFGSLGYVRRHFGDPETMRLLPEHARLSAYFNLDDGTGRIRGVQLQGNAAARPILAAFLAPFADLGAATVSIANSGSTDHVPFRGVGLPAFNFIQDPIDYESRTHHTSLDVASALLEEDLRQAAVVLASVVYHTANRAERMPRTELPKPRGH